MITASWFATPAGGETVAPWVSKIPEVAILARRRRCDLSPGAALITFRL
jgi:hypothetical protein